MRRAIVVSFCVSFLVSTAQILFSATAALAASAHVTFGIEPGSNVSGSSAPDFTFGVTGGAAVADSVAILNYSSIPVSLQVYAADAVQASSGGFGLLLPNQHSVGVGAWVKFSSAHENVSLAPASASGPTRAILPFVLRVPINASPGDHAGAILASLQTVGLSKSGKKIILEQRVGVRVYVTVSGVTRAGLRVLHVSTSEQGGAAPWQHDSLRVSYQVQNTGNVNMSLDQKVSASGLVADHGEVTLARNPIVLAGATVNEAVTIRHLWPEVLTRVVVSATGTVVTVQGLNETVHASSSSWVLTIPWLGVVILVLLIALLWWWLRRRRGASAVTSSVGVK
jgi:hypothetical protein